MEKYIKNISEEISQDLIKIRRDFHKIPELANEEFKTSNLIENVLSNIPHIQIKSNIGSRTGVMGILQGTKILEDKNSEKCVLLRADMDALPIEESVESSYKSIHPGKMHACGHDAHITWILGCAIILSRMRDKFNGSVKFLFQPAEENGTGAINLIENGILEEPYVDYVVAAHCFPKYESGKIVIPAKQAFSAAKSFEITVKGRGGHGSWPHKCVDPIAISVQIYNGLQQIISRKMDSSDSYVLSVGSIHAGPLDKGNIIPDTCTMKGTIRHMTEEGMEFLMREIEKTATYICKANDANVEINYSRGVKPIVNDSDLVRLSFDSIKSMMKEDNVEISYENNLGGEDFSFFTSERKGVYFFVGSSHKEDIGKFDLHSSDFYIDESILSSTSAYMSKIAIDLLKK